MAHPPPASDPPPESAPTPPEPTPEGPLRLTVFDAAADRTPEPARPRLTARPVSGDDEDAGLFDSHTHTAFCGHADGAIEDYARIAHRRGLAGLVVTCHNPMPEGYAADMRMGPDQLPEYVAAVERARRRCESLVEVRLGLEADYVPGYEKHVERQLAAHDFDFVLGSVHPQVPAYQAKYYDNDTLAFAKLYFRHLAESAETGLFDSLAHPDLVKQLMPRRWNVGKVLDDACRALDRVAATGVAVEFNTSGWRKRLPEPSPGPRLLYEMARRRIPVTLGSDAHRPARVGEDFRRALRLLDAAGYRRVSVFRQRQRVDLPLAAAHRGLAAQPA
ncbi:MAG: histidinol-phosphatase HisJ family protein [Planctomycetota bacterium]